MTDKTEAQPEALRLAEQLLEQAAYHRELAYCFDCRPEDTANWDHYLQCRDAANELRRQQAEIQQLKAELKELREEQRLCMLEASGLANSMFKKHFSHERQYASGEVVWGLCDSVRGVISQIDNMTSGLVRPEAQLSARQAAPDGWRMVPVASTAAMEWAFRSAEVRYSNGAGRMLPMDPHSAFKAQYREMLSAAPPPPEREPQKGDQ